ncbi:Fanconi anemia group E protein [Pezoporus occidentalis]|uniref:Fanconi anemia group E protein n=1 Tax=Pezoporus occidentalis TaxID=407982 RepID=UPI002F909BE9
MEPHGLPWLQSLDKHSRLLLHALASGSRGTLAALRMLQRVQPGEEPGPVFPWQTFTTALCAEEPALDGPEGALAVKPRLLLLPVVCQRNLFSLLLVVQALVPGSCLDQLLQALERDSHVDPWVRALGDLLRQEARAAACCPSPGLLSSMCQQQLRCLGQRIGQNDPEGRRKLKWCFSKQPSGTGDGADSVLHGGKHKEVSEESLELDEEREGKRMLLEEVVFDPPGMQEVADVAGMEEEMPEESSGDGSAQSPGGAALEGSQQEAPRKISQAEVAVEVQSFLQLHGPRLKMLLQKESSHPDLSIPPKLHVLNSCSPAQLEGLCSFLQLSTCPEHLLVRFCSWLLVLSPELSYTSAATLAQQLFLRRVLSLTQPPSRHLMAALTSFCSKYSQPFCHVLVAAVLQEPGEGAEQTKLVCELVEECLEPDSVRLVLSQVLEVPLSEKLLPIVQAVLGRQEVLPPELFDGLVLALCRQAPALGTSLGYAGLVMAVLTTYQSQVCWSRSLRASQMKPLAGTSLGEEEEEAQGLAQGRRRRQRQRIKGPSPSPQREQQAELARLPVSPDEGRMSSPQGHPDGVLAGSEQSVEHVGEVPGMDRQEVAVHTRDSAGAKEDAETLEEPLLSFPSELAVLERLGLHGVALTEQDVEAAFAHLALAFRCDVFTLRQRVQVEKRARDAAEENIQEELGQCRAALERLGPFCTDSGCRETLEQLQHSLAVLAAAVERATSAAEKLGAVHQEARMSRAAEVMVQHVENLKRHHLREHTELEEMKRLIQQNSRNRQLAESQDDAEPRLRPHPLMRTFQQGSARRRVSIAVIPKQLLPGASPESRVALAGELERDGAQRCRSTQRSELEPQGQGSAVTGDPEAEAQDKGSSAGNKEPEQLGLMSKGSPEVLWRPWLFLPQHYWVFFWLLLLSIAFLLLIRALELQQLQSVASPKA